MMKVDVLNIFEEINICTHYQLADGTLTDRFPYDLCTNEATPVYKTMKGWAQSLENLHTYDEVPAELAAYIEFLEAELNLPISFISTGPDREAIIHREAQIA
jgi:adenylosuccinate synthase